MPTASSSSIERVARLVPRDVPVGAHRLHQLRLDPVHRVQAGERVLEDHRDVLAADAAQILLGELQEIAPFEQELAADLRPLRVEQAHDREVRDALPRAGLADDAERLPAPERVGQVGDGVDGALSRRELDGEVAHVQQELAAVGHYE